MFKELKLALYIILILTCLGSVVVNFIILFNPTKWSHFAVLAVRPNSTTGVTRTQPNFWIGMGSYCVPNATCSGFSFHLQYDVSVFPKVAAEWLGSVSPSGPRTIGTIIGLSCAIISWFLAFGALYLDAPKAEKGINKKRYTAMAAGMSATISFALGLAFFFDFRSSLKRVASSFKPDEAIVKWPNGILVCWGLFFGSCGAIVLIVLGFTSKRQSADRVYWATRGWTKDQPNKANNEIHTSSSELHPTNKGSQSRSFSYRRYPP